MSDLLNALNWRYATKKFDPQKPLAPEKLARLLEALRLSASSFGLQSWKFVVVEDREKRTALVEHSWNQTQVVDASALIVFCRPTTFKIAEVDRLIALTASARGVDESGLEGYAGMMKGFLGNLDATALRHWMENQIYLALGNLLSACALEEVDACPMEGFSAENYDELLGLGDLGLASVVLCPVGYRSADDAYAGLTKIRYPAEEVVVRI